MNAVYYGIILITSSLCYAMETAVKKPQKNIWEITDIIEPTTVAELKDGTFAVGGENGCKIFDNKTKKVLHTLTSEKVYHIAPNRDGTILAITNNKVKPDLQFFNTQTGNLEWSKHCRSMRSPIIFSPINDVLFLFHYNTIYSFNHISKEIRSDTILYGDCNSYGFPLISCHPIKNEILTPRDKQEFAVAKPGKPLSLIKNLFTIDFEEITWGEYGPDGTTIAILNIDQQCAVCNLADKDLVARELAAIERYIAMAFDPHQSLLALLSRDNTIELWNYKTDQLVAFTENLANSPNLIDEIHLYKRLAFCHKNKLIAALVDKCVAIEVPQNNLFEIFCVLRHNNLPKELMLHIIMDNIVAPLKVSYDHLDLAELCNVTRIQKPLATPKVKQTQCIKAIYQKKQKAVICHVGLDFGWPDYAWG